MKKSVKQLLASQKVDPIGPRPTLSGLPDVLREAQTDELLQQLNKKPTTAKLFTFVEPRLQSPEEIVFATDRIQPRQTLSGLAAEAKSDMAGEMVGKIRGANNALQAGDAYGAETILERPLTNEELVSQRVNGPNVLADFASASEDKKLLRDVLSSVKTFLKDPSKFSLANLFKLIKPDAVESASASTETDDEMFERRMQSLRDADADPRNANRMQDLWNNIRDRAELQTAINTKLPLDPEFDSDEIRDILSPSSLNTPTSSGEATFSRSGLNTPEPSEYGSSQPGRVLSDRYEEAASRQHGLPTDVDVDSIAETEFAPTVVAEAAEKGPRFVQNDFEIKFDRDANYSQTELKAIANKLRGEYFEFKTPRTGILSNLSVTKDVLRANIIKAMDRVIEIKAQQAAAKAIAAQAEENESKEEPLALGMGIPKLKKTKPSGLKMARIPFGKHIMDQAKRDIMKRKFAILTGEIDDGNDSIQLKKELKRLIVKMETVKLFTPEEIKQMTELYEL